MKVTWIS